ncbi:hypothetical protein E6H22_08310 [Candidatus Bathyarchaeota archaeon]|nr:MAG: hypothetical protein E6H25_02215 [Candidatus Bathyarchaeota archaeon]TMI45436.1 MAG: hypothetical protein E6H22_08310 [Candidatus Bathyarchaeota archaeon]
MTAMDIPRYQPGDPSRPAIEKGPSDDQLRNLLSALISSSQDLNVRVWLDGVYTDIENAEVRGEWMKGREVYFKVEGRVDGVKTLIERSGGADR